MKLTLEGIKDKQLWSQAGIELPSYDLEELAPVSYTHLRAHET